MIKLTKITVDPTDVYDITVPATECFFANNVLVHNCQEILLPTAPFNSLDDEGEVKITTDDGQTIVLPGQHKVMLSNGTLKKARELSEEDDIASLLLEDVE